MYEGTFDPEGTQLNELMYAVKMYGSTLHSKYARIRLFLKLTCKNVS